MGWSNLTDREKQLDRAIENCGVKLDDSDRCLSRVMRNIGADSSEGEYVRSRIQLRLRTQHVLDSTDDFIARSEKMLDDFKRDDEKWERRGRALGFKFWDK